MDPGFITRKVCDVVQAIPVEVKELRGSGNEDDSSVEKDQFFSLYDRQFGRTTYVFQIAVLLRGCPEIHACIVSLVNASS